MPKETKKPPAHHILRPHHVVILAICLLLFKEIGPKNLPRDYLLYLYRFLVQELSEVAEPKSYQQLLEGLASGPGADATTVQSMLLALRNMPDHVQRADQLTNFFHSTPLMFASKSDDARAALRNRSLFGYFCRRCFVSFVKLSFLGVVKLQREYQAWCRGNTDMGYESTDEIFLMNDFQLFKTSSDFKSWARPEPFALWEKGLATGNDSVAGENLRRFFEQHFHENSDSGVRQHALLNLIRQHYLRNEPIAARKLLQEAIAVARTSGDTVTLQHCTSMLHRLQIDSKLPVLNEIQPDLHPLETLFDVSKLLNPANGQPLTSCFEKLIQAIGLYDYWIDASRASPNDPEYLGQHAMQAVVWTTMGSQGVAAAERAIVTAFTDIGGDDPNRLNVTLNMAYTKARRGAYEAALAMLLEPDVWRGITLDAYHLWANEIWHVLVLRASRRGQHRLLNEYLRLRSPTQQYSPREYVFDDDDSTSLQRIHTELYEVMNTRHNHQAVTAVEPLLSALWLSEFQCRFPMYRSGVILLADVSLEFGMSKRCRRILEEIMPQLINGDELEQRALACYTLARCIIPSHDSITEGLRQAVPYLLQAEADYSTMQMVQPLMNVQYLLSVVYHNLGMEEERDQRAARYFETDKIRKNFEEMVIDEEVTRIWEVVTGVGIALAAR